MQPKYWSPVVLKSQYIKNKNSGNKNRRERWPNPGMRFPPGTPSFNLVINGRVIGFSHIPKCAGTSVKTMLLEAAGIDWQNTPAHDWGLPENERLYRGQMGEFIKEFWIPKYEGADITKFAVIRDPVERVISMFTNRVLFHRKAPHLNNNWDRFMDEFPRFHDGDLLHHSKSLVRHLGIKTESFDRVFTIYEMDEVAKYISEIAGKEILPHHRQRGGAEHKPHINISEYQINKIKRYYEEDYAHWWNKDVVPQAFDN